MSTVPQIVYAKCDSAEYVFDSVRNHKQFPYGTGFWVWVDEGTRKNTKLQTLHKIKRVICEITSDDGDYILITHAFRVHHQHDSHLRKVIHLQRNGVVKRTDYIEQSIKYRYDVLIIE